MTYQDGPWAPWKGPPPPRAEAVDPVAIAPGECAAALSRMAHGKGNSYDAEIVRSRLRELEADLAAARSALLAFEAGAVIFLTLSW